MNRPNASRAQTPTFSPLYRQIKDLMLRSLASGEWNPGDVIPSESELAVKFNVSQGTVRKAIDEMAAENLLIRRQGKGTFVATHDDPRSFFRFLRLKSNDGGRFVETSIPLKCHRQTAGKDVARVLVLTEGVEVIALKRILKFDETPVVFDTIYLSAELFPDLTLDVLQQSDCSLYSLFETRYGIRMIRAEERISAVAADPESAEKLGVHEGSPLLLVERVAFTYGDQPVEWRRGVYATRDHHYFNELG